ncbi:NAD(P)-binding protein [Nanoarchaeota archaeon]
MKTIIGAGPAGSFLAYLLASEGISVEVYDTKHKIGTPISCTGILTSSIEKFINLKNSPNSSNSSKRGIVANRIKKIEVFSPNNENVVFKLKNPDYIVHRDKFDNYIKGLAQDAGAQFNLGSKFLKNTQNYIELKKVEKVDKKNPHKNKIIKKSYSHLIGCDGALSSVARHNRVYKKQRIIPGYQIRTNYQTDKDTIKVWLDHGEFAWIVPESESISRIGLVSRKNGYSEFSRFLKEKCSIDLSIYNSKSNSKRISKQTKDLFQGGPIPIYNPKQNLYKRIGSKHNSKHVYLLGDAAGQVKATTYGGIIPSFRAAKCLSQAIIRNKPLDYEQCIKKGVARELNMSLRIRAMMNKFSKKDYEKMFTLCQKQKTKNIIENIDRDNITKMVPRMIFSNPKLALFGLKMMIKGLL